MLRSQVKTTTVPIDVVVEEEGDDPVRITVTATDEGSGGETKNGSIDLSLVTNDFEYHDHDDIYIYIT